MRQLHRQQRDHGRGAAIDPRISLLAALFLLCLVISSGNMTFPWLVASCCLVGSLVFGMPLRTLAARMLHPLLLALVVLLFKTALGPAGSSVIQVAGFSIKTHPDGIHAGIIIASRIIGAMSIIVLLNQIMCFTEIMAALAWLRVPRGLIEVSLFAWRALFVLYDDAATVYIAQKNRLGYCGVARGLRSFGTMAGMLTIRAFDSSHAMTVAMTQRGFDGSLPLLLGSRIRTSQIAGLLLFALLATTAWSLQN